MTQRGMSRKLEHIQNVGRARALLDAPPDGWMETLGARISEAEPGRVVLELVAGPQHRHGGGVVQGGVITQIADAAMGMSLMHSGHFFDVGSGGASPRRERAV